MQSPESVPVLILIFNRPDKVRALIEALAEARPSRLYVAADGPRAGVPSDAARCVEARAIAQAVSWPCEVRTLFSERNLGVDPAVEAGITWFFEHETEGIILEDDCLPHPDFFPFAGEMLERYRDDVHVMVVSGNNFQNGVEHGDGSYYFSQYANTWGWATWRRAWEAYDTDLGRLPDFLRAGTVRSIRPETDEQRHWLRYFKKLRSGVHTPWDAKWMFALWSRGGVSIVPNANLVENIGFGDDATHTFDEGGLSVKARHFPPPYRAPTSRETNEDADRYLFKRFYRVTFLGRIRYILRIYAKSRSRTSA